MSDYTITSTIPVHETGILCAHVVGNVIATGSYDRTVRLSELTTGATLLTLRGHKKAVRCVQISNNLTISGSNDNSIRVWNNRTGACIKELVGHKAPVTAMQVLEDNYLMSSSQDSTIKLWDLDRGECHDTFRQNGPIECFQSVEDLVVIAAKGGHYNSTLFAIDSHTGERVQTYQNAHWVKSLHFDGRNLVTGHYFPYVVKSWDISTGLCHYELSGHQGAVGGLQWRAHGRQLFSCSKEDNIHVWSTDTKSCMRVLDGQKQVSGLQCLNQHLVSWSELNGDVAIWTSQQPMPILTY